ncbi:hypothetical protein IX51_06880 [uncultured archaeon]|nr:hypothetical protein IX51_06880 [uncultured archaeon]
MITIHIQREFLPLSGTPQAINQSLQFFFGYYRQGQDNNDAELLRDHYAKGPAFQGRKMFNRTTTIIASAERKFRGSAGIFYYNSCTSNIAERL